MPPLNVTENIAYPQLEIPGLNHSIFMDVSESGNVYTLSVTDNSTQFIFNATRLVLNNGTRSKSNFYRRVPGTPTIAALFTVISFYTCPMIIAFGLVSNLLAYMVFTRTRLRKVPSVPYLAAMAVVDSGALLTEFVQNGIALHGIHIIIWSGVCQYTTYFSYIFIFLCIWYPVALCVEKFICVYFPLRKAALCTTFRAKVVVISMVVMTGTCYYYVIYMTGPVDFGNVVICQVWDFFRKDFSKLMMLDYVFTFVFPSIILIILVILICGRGCEYYRISSTADVSNRVEGTRSSIRAPVRVTNVIFPVIVFILILKLPMGLLRLYGATSSPPRSQLMLDMQNVFLYAGRFEWVIKLYIYLIFSASFRRRTKSFVCSLRAKLKDQCVQDSLEVEEVEPMAATPRINLPDRSERAGNPRAFLMASDV